MECCMKDYLTEPEKELVVCLMEEAGEVIVDCSKLLRHGMNSSNPFLDKKETNIEALEREVGDFREIMMRLCDMSLLNFDNVYQASLEKNKNLDQWLHGRLLG
jgi:hypothetical protein